MDGISHLKALLNEGDYNRKELAEYAGISKTTLSSYLNRHTSPPVTTMMKMLMYINHQLVVTKILKK